MAAKIDDSYDIKLVGRWINQDEAASASGLRTGKAFAVTDALSKKGVTLDRAQELAITAALADADQGDMHAQCRHVDVIWHIYTGQSPGEDERALFIEKRHACIGNNSGRDLTVDIRLFKSYAKQLSTTSVPTLERALIDKAGSVWQHYYGAKIAWLNSNGFTHAAMRFIAVVAFADVISGGQWQKKRRYLQLYFFEYHLGCGMPEEKCMEAALCVSSGDGSAAGLEMRPTVQWWAATRKTCDASDASDASDATRCGGERRQPRRP